MDSFDPEAGSWLDGETTIYCNSPEELTPDMARDIAAALIRAAELVERDAASG